MTSGRQSPAEIFYSLVADRRSIRRYEASAVPAETLDRVLAAARWAPSAHNRQPWRFAMLTAFDWKDRLALAMGERLRRDRLADGDSVAAIEQDVARSYARITGAPVVIVVALDMADMDRYPDDRRRAEHTMAVQSAAMAVQNLLLAAHAEGLGACWMCAPLFCPDVVTEALGLPKGWEPQAIVTLGRPAGPGKPATRRPIDEISWTPRDAPV
ncbi:MAG TPA: nitroreductase family protein [Stellaceae bacterium]|jgi:coenzyme F420-0:L-glutamate ligase/coenzyme F420-1:gamma-L-glutamate ligase|nr:nitroreductase family protein [Stellaceae bacterium]